MGVENCWNNESHWEKGKNLNGEGNSIEVHKI